MKTGLPIDKPHRFFHRVGADLTVPKILPGSLLALRGEEVLASGFLTAIIENYCWQAAMPYVEDHENLVGWGFAGKQKAPVVPGDVLAIEATCKRRHAQDLTWYVEAFGMSTSDDARW